MNYVTRVERGGVGNPAMQFRRVTILTCGQRVVRVSTVGKMSEPTGNPLVDGVSDEFVREMYAFRGDRTYMAIGFRRFYETMAFDETPGSTGMEFPFESDWTIPEITDDSDARADAMHEAVVAEISAKLGPRDPATLMAHAVLAGDSTAARALADLLVESVRNEKETES